ncbi:uncharacterized protein METZ01_LOCUS442680, partial [marine metagenome]
MMITIEGPPSHSPYRLNQLLSELQSIDSSVTSIGARYIHFIDNSEELTNKDYAVLNPLLSYGPDWGLGANKGDKIIVIPRIGTTSPWSSKATDIAHGCGLSSIHRVERGLIYTLVGLTDDQHLRTRCFATLYDRMTQQAITQFDQLERMFEIDQPQSFTTISILSEGIEALEAANTELGLALNNQEMNYLLEQFQILERDPTDAELMMF